MAATAVGLMVAAGSAFAAPAAQADQTVDVSFPSTDEITLHVQSNEVITFRENGCNDLVLYNPYFFALASDDPSSSQ